MNEKKLLMKVILHLNCFIFIKTLFILSFNKSYSTNKFLNKININIPGKIDYLHRVLEKTFFYIYFRSRNFRERKNSRNFCILRA